MEFILLSEKEYQKYWENHPQKTFLSTIEIGKLRKKNGWDVSFVGIKDDKKLIGAAMLTSHIRRFGKKEFYSPRGVLVDYNNEKYLNYFMKELKKLGKY